MSASQSFRIIIRLLGIAGVCGGGFVTFIGCLIALTKAGHMDGQLVAIGAAVTIPCLYLACGAPGLLVPASRRSLQQSDDA